MWRRVHGTGGALISLHSNFRFFARAQQLALVLKTVHLPGMQLARASLLLVAFVGSGLPSVSALACSFPPAHYTDIQLREFAASSIKSATTIIDGEVLVPMTDKALPDGAMPVAYVKVLHTWKGRVEDNIAPVAYFSSCDIFLSVKGQKFRILLDGSRLFTADQETNGAAVDQRIVFNNEVDRLLGAPRPGDFASFPGNLLPEKPRH